MWQENISLVTDKVISAGWSRSKRRENEVYVGVSGPKCRQKSANKNWKQII
jgi:hypothetical protein